MKSRLSVLLLSACGCLISSLAASAGDNGKALLAEVMDKPGYWYQMCSGPGAIAFDAPVPVYSGVLLTRHFHLSPKNVQRVQAARATLLPPLVEALTAMDLAKPPKVLSGKKIADFENARSGFLPDWLNAQHLRIIQELNAVETLPELLRLEAQLHSMLEAAQKDSNALLPPFDLDSPGFFEKPADKNKKHPDKWWESPEHKRDEAIFACRVVQREILGTITVLLQREQWPDLQKRFGPQLQENVARELAETRKQLTDTKKNLAKAETDDDRASYQRWQKREEDRIKELESGTALVGFEVTYTPALRAEIRAMAESFLKTVPPEKRRAAAAMPKHGD